MATKIRILLVDDSAVIRRLLTDVLSGDPTLEVADTAANGRIALTKLATVKPDLVILDVEMPEMDGLETLTEIRKRQPRLPVIMTGMGQDGLRGCEAIQQTGGSILAQDEASSVVWGMPGAVVKAGLADGQIALPQLAREILARVRVGR